MGREIKEEDSVWKGEREEGKKDIEEEGDKEGEIGGGGAEGGQERREMREDIAESIEGGDIGKRGREVGG